ncbi:hypothetical protein PGT21_019271 [Puccinia graminis f. sp. tritici]|uniref:Uncharacterized protein n=1 Tax=Puccinia graminis f. sp. tritici TaxID=56615 RepID=A0A5B0PD49_PUCGR|nr:hypothetical protein PGT21_019271 [Puccinia graminis f. sp. tritici]
MYIKKQVYLLSLISLKLRALRSSDDEVLCRQLIRHRYDIQNYTAANQAVDWFTDRLMIESFKKIISFYLNRVNTFNGIRIGDDETILAFETGNEMNWGNQNQTIRMSTSIIPSFSLFWFW